MRARVVAQHGALADAEASAAFEMDDVAIGQRRRADLDRLAAALHAEVRVRLAAARR